MNKNTGSQSINNNKINKLFNKAFNLMNSQTLPKNTTTNHYLHFISDLNYSLQFKFQASLPFDYHEAIKILSSLLLLEPQNKYALHLQGTCYYLINKYHEAKNCFHKSLNIDKHYTLPYNSLGNIYHKRDKNYKKAIKHYDLCLKTNPEIKSALFNRATAYLSLKEYQSAYKGFLKYHEISPGFIPALEYLSRISFKLELYQETLRYTSEFIDINNSNADIHYIRAHAFHKLHQNKEAVKHYDRAAELDPKYKKKEDLIEGMSFQNPYQVMFVHDVYNIIKKDYPYHQTISQKLVYHQDSKYDVMELSSREGENISLYFKYLTLEMPVILKGSISLPDEPETEAEYEEEEDSLSLKELVERVRKQVEEAKDKEENGK